MDRALKQATPSAQASSSDYNANLVALEDSFFNAAGVGVLDGAVVTAGVGCSVDISASVFLIGLGLVKSSVTNFPVVNGATNYLWAVVDEDDAEFVAYELHDLGSPPTRGALFAKVIAAGGVPTSIVDVGLPGRNDLLPWANFAGIANEVVAARGSKASVDERLDVVLNENGTLKNSVVAVSNLSFDPATQAELNAAIATCQPIDSDLTAIAALSTTAFGRALLVLADAAALRTAGGLGALAVLATVGTAQIDNDAVTYAKIQNVSATDKLLGRSTAGAGDIEEIDCTAAGRAILDDADAAAQRTTLGAAPRTGEFNTQSGTSYTLVAGDNGKTIICDNASPFTLTVPASLGAGFNCLVYQKGAGQVTPTASSTTIHQRQSFTKTAGQYAIATLLAVAADVFALGGDLA